MRARIEFPTQSNLGVDDIRHLIETPEDELFLWRKFSNGLYTEVEEACLIKAFEGLLLEDKAVQACANAIIGGFYAFTNKPYKDIGKGLQLLNEAADSNNASALVNLALWYAKCGEMRKAKEFYEKASSLNNITAKYCLARMYLIGNYPVTQDIINATVLFREVVSYSDAKSQLEALKAKYPVYDLIQYHCTMALAPEKLGLLFVNNAKSMSEFIIDDSLIKEDKAKYQLLTQCAKGSLIDIALTLSGRASAFIANQLLSDTPDLSPKTAPLLRKCYSANSRIGEALHSLQREYPNDAFVQYHYTMALEPSKLDALFDSYPELVSVFVKDTLPTKDEKYKVYETLSKANRDSVVDYALSGHHLLPDSIFHLWVLDEYGSAEKAALAFRESYLLEPAKFDFLIDKYPKNPVVNYHYAQLSSDRDDSIAKLYKHSPKDISLCILNDEFLDRDEKYHLFIVIMNNVDLDSIPFSEDVVDFMSLQEAEERMRATEAVVSHKSTKLIEESTTILIETVKKIGSFTCEIKGASLLIRSPYEDEVRLSISIAIASGIDKCTSLLDLALLVKSDEMKKFNDEGVVDEWVGLIEQCALIEEDNSTATKTEEPFVFTKKSVAIPSRALVDNAAKKEASFNVFEIIEDSNLSDEAKYHYLRKIQQESNQKKQSLPDEVVLFIEELEAKFMMAETQHEESTKRLEHRIGNFTFEFDESAFGLMLDIVSDNQVLSTLSVSPDIQKAIFSYTSIFDVLDLLKSSSLREQNSVEDVELVMDAIESYNDPIVSLGNTQTFFSSSVSEEETLFVSDEEEQDSNPFQKQSPSPF